MKAVIMAGGFGTRLMPVTACCPKPMIRVLDKPIIQYTLELLKKHNITEACLTLGYLPKMIESFVTVNEGFGVNASCVVEDKPMGTAGSVKMCKEFIGKDDFIVLSGDAICDFDLAACIDRHYTLNSKASLVLYSHPKPLEYGLVVTDDDGRIQGFVEKPSWDKVETDLVNTGIYIFSNEILDRIPDDTQWDFGKDVFPSLLSEDYPLYGIEAKGYWCDVGDPTSYRNCTRDILDGKTKLPVPTSASVSSETAVIPPVFISPEAHVAKGAVIGAYSVIGQGSVIGKNAKIAGAIIDGGAVMEDCDIESCIMCQGSQALPGAKIGEGCVVGNESIIGGRAVLMPEVCIWPRQKIEAGKLVNRNIVSGALRGWPQFSGAGKMIGEYNSTLTPEICFALGAACAILGKVGIASTNSPAAKTLASSMSCGVSAAGGEGFMIDVDFAAGAAYLGHNLGLGITAFMSEKNGDTEIVFTDINGMPISRDTERKLEAVFASGRKLAASDSTEAANHIGGGTQLYSAAVMRSCCLGVANAKVKIKVLGENPESNVLRAVLTRFGCELVENNYGAPVFELYNGGTRLRAKDEAGHEVNWEHLICILAMIEMEHGSGRIAVPFEAPRMIDEIAGKYGKQALRLGREQEALNVFVSQPWLRDGIFALVRIVAAMAKSDSKLMNMAYDIPDFSTATREVVLSGKRGEAMRKLSGGGEFVRDGGPGLWYKSDKGCARVRPMPDREALMVTAECASMEAAEELCGSIRDMIEKK